MKQTPKRLILMFHFPNISYVRVFASLNRVSRRGSRVDYVATNPNLDLKKSSSFNMKYYCCCTCKSKLELQFELYLTFPRELFGLRTYVYRSSTAVLLDMHVFGHEEIRGSQTEIQQHLYSSNLVMTIVPVYFIATRLSPENHVPYQPCCCVRST